MFDSYLDPDVQLLGDLDLEVIFRSRMPDTISIVDWNENVRTYARASGRHFRDLFYAVSWPEDEAMKLLRNGSSVITISDENVWTLSDRWEVVCSYNVS